jgi:hypothetical protein
LIAAAITNNLIMMMKFHLSFDFALNQPKMNPEPLGQSMGQRVLINWDSNSN